MKKKRVILIGLSLFFFLVSVFSVKVDWLKEFAFLEVLNKNLIQKLNKASRVLAFEYTPYFFPRFPQRLIYLLSEAEGLIKELVEQNEELNNQLRESNCQFALSECLPEITFGGTGCTQARVLGQPYRPYRSIEKIETSKEEIADRINNLSYLRELLIKEKEGGLQKELESLRPETAEELKGELEKVLRKSEEIILAAKENQDLYNKDYIENCIAQCQSGPVCGVQACARGGSGPQKHIKIKAKAGISLDDLKFGKVKLKNFHLALPDKIQFPSLADIVFTIPRQSTLVCFPFKPITISIEPPSLATLPSLGFSCPKLKPEWKIPEVPVPKIPREISIPFPEIPEIKWCPKVPEIGREITTTASQEVIESFEQQIKEAMEEIDKQINQINEALKEAPDDALEKAKKEYEKSKEELEKESQKVKDKYEEEKKTQGVEFKKGGKEISTQKYFEMLDWLTELCSSLPTMTSQWDTLKVEAENCYNPETVIKTINDECKKIWQGYCQEGATEEPPQICKEIRNDCNDEDGRVAITKQCQNLFRKKELPIPSECNYSTLENKCQELLNEKEIPEPCKIFLLFSGEIGTPSEESSSGPQESSPSKKLLNVPFGLGGGLGFNCPIVPPTIPKIVLPDIVIPDIHLPKFGIPPFLRVKLPNIIFEDLRLPDINLCDLNNCSNIFPYLSFKLPRLSLPSFDISLPLPQLPGSSLEGRLKALEINFSLPQINLFNLLLPELELPEIPHPSPKVSFAITGIDLGAIFDLLFTFILNSLDVPDFSGCLQFKTQTKFLDIAIDDYYFSFLKFPETVKIPFCDPVNKFCSKIKTTLGEGGWLKKAREIETAFNNLINQEVQKKLDEIGELINIELQNQINLAFKEYQDIIYQEILKQLEKLGLPLEDYINPKTMELDLSKVPFPGVFPIKTAERECLSVPLPETQIILRFDANLPEKKVERGARQTIVYLPFLPEEISIPWERLGISPKISLAEPLSYDIPPLPLSKLSYQKEFSIKTIGFQPRTFSFNFGKANEGDCLAKPPTGGNPFPIRQITNQLDKIKSLRSEFENASQAIIKILE